MFARESVNAPAGPVELVLITLQNSVTGCSISLPFQYSRYLRDDSKRIIRKITISHLFELLVQLSLLFLYV